MFKCRECGYVFDEPHVYHERHGFTSGSFEKFSECPHCYSPDFGDANIVEAEQVSDCDYAEEEDD